MGITVLALSIFLRNLLYLIDIGLFRKVLSIIIYSALDTPPNLGILTIKALSAAHTVVIPVSPDGCSLQGFMQLMASVQAVREYNNRELKIGGILITRYAPQTNVGKQIRVIASELAEAANTKGLPNRYPPDCCGKREHQRTTEHRSLFACFHSSTGLSLVEKEPNRRADRKEDVPRVAADRFGARDRFL